MHDQNHDLLPLESLIFDVGTADFEEKVVKASFEKPVLVDFWAPWCGPCKQLMPVLEQVVEQAGGDILMAKVNVDENQQLAQALRIQSVPTVFAFFQGRPVDAFQGVLPEGQIKAFIDKIVQAARNTQPDAIDIPEALSQAAQALSDNDLATAQAIYSQILSQDQKNAKAYTGLVRSFIVAGHIEQAVQLVENAPEDIAADPAFGEAKTAVELAQGSMHADIPALQSKIEANPKDHESRLELAGALFASGQKQEAAEHLLESIRLDAKWNEQQARKELLKMFEAMGHSDPLTIEMRRKLSSLLFA